jgi:hypothetical protein
MTQFAIKPDPITIEVDTKNPGLCGQKCPQLLAIDVAISPRRSEKAHYCEFFSGQTNPMRPKPLLGANIATRESGFRRHCLCVAMTSGMEAIDA